MEDRWHSKGVSTSSCGCFIPPVKPVIHREDEYKELQRASCFWIVLREREPSMKSCQVHQGHHPCLLNQVEALEHWWKPTENLRCWSSGTTEEDGQNDEGTEIQEMNCASNGRLTRISVTIPFLHSVTRISNTKIKMLGNTVRRGSEPTYTCSTKRNTQSQSKDGQTLRAGNSGNQVHTAWKKVLEKCEISDALKVKIKPASTNTIITDYIKHTHTPKI